MGLDKNRSAGVRSGAETENRVLLITRDCKAFQSGYRFRRSIGAAKGEIFLMRPTVPFHENRYKECGTGNLNRAAAMVVRKIDLDIFEPHFLHFA